jgi:hypothetical protein
MELPAALFAAMPAAASGGAAANHTTSCSLEKKSFESE